MAQLFHHSANNIAKASIVLALVLGGVAFFVFTQIARSSYLTGKTVVVVGANTGIGYEAAKHFASMNPDRLIMACRSQERGNAAVTSE